MVVVGGDHLTISCMLCVHGLSGSYHEAGNSVIFASMDVTWWSSKNTIMLKAGMAGNDIL